MNKIKKDSGWWHGKSKIFKNNHKNENCGRKKLKKCHQKIWNAKGTKIMIWTKTWIICIKFLKTRKSKKYLKKCEGVGKWKRNYVNVEAQYGSKLLWRGGIKKKMSETAISKSGREKLKKNVWKLKINL